MNIVKTGDMVSCKHNNHMVTGELIGFDNTLAFLYLTDATGGYTIEVPVDSLVMPCTNELAYIFDPYHYEESLGRMVKAPFNQELIDFINRPKIEPIVISQEEEISKPKRYNKVGTLECWDVILDQKMDFLEGSILKYVWRHKEKNGKHDLKKAKEYLEKMIADYDKLYGDKT